MALWTTMEIEKGSSIFNEGTDGSGKATAASAEIELILEQTDYNVLFTSFPTYSNPLGTMVRMMNRGLADEFAEKNGLEFGEELVLRTGMYALDRAIIYLIIENSQVNSDHKYVHISDRMFLSQSNTLAYLVDKYKKGEEAKEMFLEWFEIAYHSDLEIQSLVDNFNPILIPNSVDNSFSTNRIELDNLEQKGPRDLANWGYSLIPLKLPHIHSKIFNNQEIDGSWKEKYDIAAQILNYRGYNIKPTKSTHPRLVNNNELETRVKTISPLDYLESFYVIKPEISNTFQGDIFKWKKLMLMYNKDSQNLFNVEKKILLNKVEEQLSIDLSSIMNELEPSEIKLDQLQGWPLEAINRIVNEYSDGNIRKLIFYIESKMEYGHGFTKLLTAILERC